MEGKIVLSPTERRFELTAGTDAESVMETARLSSEKARSAAWSEHGLQWLLGSKLQLHLVCVVRVV